MLAIDLFEKWTEKYKRSIDCNNPKGFSQRAHCAGRKKHNESELTLMDGFRELLPLAVKHLKLPKIPKIHLNKEQSGTHQASFGGYDSGTDDIHLTISNRHPVDILRTLAHELVHYKQKLNGELVDDSWKTGSPAENEANSEAGVIMRLFNKANPEFMNVKPIISETIRHQGSKWVIYSKDGKKKLGTYTTKKDAEKRLGQIEYFKHANEGNNFYLNNKYRNRQKGFITVDGIHQLADKLGINWDNNPNFMKMTKLVTGKEHLDDLSVKELIKMRDHLLSLHENFADGKVRGKSRPGRVKKAGASCKGSVSDLRAKAKKYSGEKGKMYHWCANMKAGKAK
jgi:hypothetical protein